MDQNKLFEEQLEDEEIITFFRKHWIEILPSLFLLFLMALGIVLLGIIFSFGLFPLPRADNPFFIIFYACFIFVTTIFLHYFFITILNYFFHVFIITNQRIVEIKKDLFRDDTIEFKKVEEIGDLQKDQQGIIRRIFNYGKLIGLKSSGDITLVPDPQYYLDIISRLKLEKAVPTLEEQVLEENNDKIDLRNNDNTPIYKDISGKEWVSPDFHPKDSKKQEKN